MDLTVLGASGTYPSRGGACSGYLLRHDGFSMWMDAGSGTLGRLQEHVPIEDVGALFLSHVHADHCVDLYTFFYALFFHPDGPRHGVTIIAPPGTRDFLGQLMGDDARRDFGTLFEWRELRAGDESEVGPFRMRMYDAVHSAENLTVRIEADDKTFCYSGDTGPNDELPRAAEGADLFLCEASWQECDKPIVAPIHLRAMETGAVAKAAGVDRLVLTHIWPRHDLDVSHSEAAEHFGGPIELAARSKGWSL
jgi:ribonuclease BN (tRNA processing enzyme)